MLRDMIYSSFSEANKELAKHERMPHFAWVSVEKSGFYECQVDLAFGQVRLIHNGNEVCRGKYSCSHENVVALDAEYFGVPKYIWR